MTASHDAEDLARKTGELEAKFVQTSVKVRG